MTLIAILSSVALIVFSVGYFGRLIHLRIFQNIQANTMGRHGKSHYLQTIEWLIFFLTLLFILLWVQSFVRRETTGWTVALLLPLEGKVFSALYGRILGLVLSWVGVLLFVAAVLNMGASWRVGIDPDSEVKLVTSGLFALSRNPIYVGFCLIFAGVFITWPGVTLGATSLLIMILLHLLTRQEELFLEKRFGCAYRSYCQITPRYVLPLQGRSSAHKPGVLPPEMKKEKEV